ncbi:MAG: hypothetical protein ACOYL3_25135 [Desulfuromonadaceae bacterium]
MLGSAIQRLNERVPVEIGPVLVMTELQPDGNYVTISQTAMKNKYTSDFFASKPDGEFTLFINQGGIANRDFPKDEKLQFKRSCCRIGEGMQDFRGYARLFIQNGEVIQVRFEPVK